MSENRFKVPAKSRPSPSAARSSSVKSPKGKTAVRKNGGNVSQTKLEKARVVRKTSSSHARSLPDIQDMGNMTRDERIRAVLKNEGVKVGSCGKKGSTDDRKRSDRYSGMKSIIAGNRTASDEARKSETVYEKKKDSPVLFMRIAFIALVLILLSIALILVQRAGVSPSSNAADSSYGRVTEKAVETAEPDSPVAVEVIRGMGAGEVSRLFSPFFDSDMFLSYLVGNDLTTSILPGKYLIDSSMTIEEAAALITQTVKSRSVTVYAGYTVDDTDEMLANRGLASRGDFLEACDALMKEYSLPFVEGYLMSGVYEFTNCYDLAYRMLSATLDWFRSRAGALASSSLSMDETVKIASMVNRETQDADQMPVIAAVILNRYESDMPLGIDATTRYELDNWTGRLPQSAYEEITPYNTRRKKGLPPSGIGCPSPESLESVLAPSDTEALYYLHDKDGRLYTSSTYEEHLETYERLY